MDFSWWTTIGCCLCHEATHVCRELYSLNMNNGRTQTFSEKEVGLLLWMSLNNKTTESQENTEWKS